MVSGFQNNSSPPVLDFPELILFSKMAAQSTGDPGSSSTSGKGLTESNKIALGVGIGFGIPSVIGVIIACVNCMHRY
jgi:hypothetical protein